MMTQERKISQKKRKLWKKREELLVATEAKRARFAATSLGLGLFSLTIVVSFLAYPF